ncbi:hypothetical protein CLU81_0597 [Flavobacterium sp. 9]|nr:hypothetical protein CLU81_0597 [Flavobacterium sp. 9]
MESNYLLFRNIITKLEIYYKRRILGGKEVLGSEKLNNLQGICEGVEAMDSEQNIDCTALKDLYWQILYSDTGN